MPMLSSAKLERMVSKSLTKPVPGSAYNLYKAFIFTIHDSICYFAKSLLQITTVLLTQQIMANLENLKQAFEGTAKINRQEIEKNERVTEEFEDQIKPDQIEGLFFKNLWEKAPQGNIEAKFEAPKIGEVTKESAGSMI
uniref:Uncharacterized protein LOC114913017 n=1 Tax=Elaeis guineensis var. tenera TaxID=51953 RepID=A0A8N4ER39_ELAGV|nr:uncharacterized protein LOC114913017 [Elaeis guineensis]